jgi:hypothetical protein
MAENQGVWFWLLNFGILIPVVLVYLVSLVVRLRIRRGDVQAQKAWVFVAPALTWFLLCTVFRVHPLASDNAGIMVWSYLVMLPFFGEWLADGFSRAERTGVTVLLFFSGFLSMLGGIQTGQVNWELGVRPELSRVSVLLDPFNYEERFATAPSFDHPLLLLGRKVAVGSPSQLWRDGLDYTTQLQDLDILMEGQEGWRESAKRLGVRYLFWGFREIEHYPDSTKPWVERIVGASEWGNIYRLDDMP